MKFRIYIDLDDTICDYTRAHVEARLRTPGILYPQAVHGFFRGLVEVPGAVSAVKILKDWGHDVWILTRPSTMNRLCYTEKADWVYEHLGQEWVDKLILCPDKALLKGDILVDDVPWPGFEGIQLQFGYADYQVWLSVLHKIQQMEIHG